MICVVLSVTDKRICLIKVKHSIVKVEILISFSLSPKLRIEEKKVSSRKEQMKNLKGFVADACCTVGFVKLQKQSA